MQEQESQGRQLWGESQFFNMPEFIVPDEDDASVFPEEFTPEKIRERREREYEDVTDELFRVLEERGLQ